jgi:hypothetical protein
MAMNPFGRYKSFAFTRRFGVLWAVLLFALFGLLLAQTARAQQSSDSHLTAHEWGTFTSIAGADGNALLWLPIATKSDLPTFVEHYPNANVKGGLRGTVRMETPVIYFYSPRQVTVAASVSLAAGLITEWFPHASHVRPANSSPITLDPQSSGSIGWDAVTVSPATNANFSRESASSHYYDARETSASTVSVQTPAGNQLEKFLFYRGVSLFAPPLSAKVLATGRLQLKSNVEGSTTIILFERRGDKLGYRVSSLDGDATLDPPSTSGTLDSLYSDFEDSSRKACTVTRLAPCWKPGVAPGSKKAAGSSASFHGRSSTPSCLSRYLRRPRDLFVYSSAASSLSLQPPKMQSKPLFFLAITQPSENTAALSIPSSTL